MNAIVIEGLSHTYPVAKNRPAVPVLNNLSLTILQGEIFGLLGPNGGGKSTLFKILSTLMQPTAGTAVIFNHPLLHQSKAVRNKIGVVFQNPSLDKKLTLLENILLQGQLYGLSADELSSRTQFLLTQFNLLERQHDMVEHLSGGLQRRGEIIKGIIHQPSLLLMDEPSTGLDPGARRDLWAMLEKLKNLGITILLTTHLMEEADRCDRLAILHKGHCVALGTPAELKSRIGGDVISIDCTNPSLLVSGLTHDFQIHPQVFDNIVRFERHNGPQFIPTLTERFPGMINAITVGKPTLEDVFLHETGDQL